MAREGGDLLTPKQTKALAALLTQPTKEKAASAAGIGLTTLKRYLADPEFQARYDEARRELLENATKSLQARTGGAVDTMWEICQNEATPPQVRLNASEAILRNSLKFTETTDILKQLQELEQWRAENDGKH